MVAAETKKALEELALACEVIRNEYECHRCPFEGSCLEDLTFNCVSYKATPEAINEMLKVADEITEEQEEEAKTEEERRWEAEADYWNDRRCDPDWD